MKYSLANYILTIKANDPAMNGIFGSSNSVSVGGEGSYTDSINISMNSQIWQTTGFATGGWVHDKSLDRTGMATVSLSQLSDRVAKFKTLCNMYFSGDYEGLTMILNDSDGNEVAKCEDCFVTKIPDQSFGSKASMQNWSFTCGKITIN